MLSLPLVAVRCLDKMLRVSPLSHEHVNPLLLLPPNSLFRPDFVPSTYGSPIGSPEAERVSSLPLPMIKRELYPPPTINVFHSLTQY